MRYLALPKGEGKDQKTTALSQGERVASGASQVRGLDPDSSSTRAR